jgi:hypothetical protein
MYNDEDVTELLNSHKQVLTLNNVAEIHKQSKLYAAKEHQPEERPITVSKLSKGLGRTKAGINVFQDIYSEKRKAATTRQDSEGVRREVFFCQTLHFSLHGHLQRLVHHHLHFWAVYLLI